MALKTVLCCTTQPTAVAARSSPLFRVMAGPQLPFHGYFAPPMTSSPSNLTVAFQPPTTPFNFYQQDLPRHASQFGDHNMEHSRPAWAGGHPQQNMPPQQAPQGVNVRQISVDVNAFIHTRDNVSSSSLLPPHIRPAISSARRSTYVNKARNYNSTLTSTI